MRIECIRLNTAQGFEVQVEARTGLESDRPNLLTGLKTGFLIIF